jgi:hypothetical protein
MKKLIAALVVLVVFAGVAQAHIGHLKTREGRDYTDKRCNDNCSFQEQSDGDLKMDNTFSGSDAHVWYDVSVPSGHLVYSAGTYFFLGSEYNCQHAGFHDWFSSPSPGVVRLHGQIENIGTCTIKRLEVRFIGP